MMSASARAGRRGGITLDQFLLAMHRLGFAVVPPGPGMLHEFTHWQTGERRYSMPLWNSYSRTLERLQDELREHVAKRRCSVVQSQ
jgi:hypothetical protein